jgi:hypothetical protein
MDFGRFRKRSSLREATLLAELCSTMLDLAFHCTILIILRSEYEAIGLFSTTWIVQSEKGLTGGLRLSRGSMMPSAAQTLMIVLVATA